MAIDVGTIEEAVITTIKADPTMSAYLKTCESYQGQLEADLQVLPRLFPAAFVMFERSEYRPMTNEEESADFTFSMLLASQTYQGNIAARTGTPGMVGVYTMLRDLRKLLVGQTFGLPDFPPFLLVSEEALLNTKALSVYAAEYKSSGHVIPLGA